MHEYLRPKFHKYNNWFETQIVEKMDIVNKNRAGLVIFKLSNFQNRVEKKAVCPLVTDH